MEDKPTNKIVAPYPYIYIFIAHQATQDSAHGQPIAGMVLSVTTELFCRWYSELGNQNVQF